jgi:hypothetical protein
MGFKAAKVALVDALRQRNFEHENREPEKNLLAVGDIEADEVARLVLKTSSREYDESQHHWDPSVAVHTFRPTVDGQRWYIKAYFIGRPEDGATFISVHRSE